MKVSILAENYSPFALGVKAEHGFSVFIEKDRRLFLYDTGYCPYCLEKDNQIYDLKAKLKTLQ